MAEKQTTPVPVTTTLTIRHRGRIEQTFIYFIKFLRLFFYQSDWKVLPMTALIAGLVGFVVGRNFLVTMESTITGSFALVCVCIWNGCFNSIQAVCREREVIKREHRSGMHISSYIMAQMLYQFLICLAQTIITIQMTRTTGMKYPDQGLFTRWSLLDFAFTIFLITYASDMMSLWISSISRSTTTAMTIMPFVLVFQLLFSGGIIAIPSIAKPIASFTVSNPGLKALASQADTNSRHFATMSRMLNMMKDTEINTSITLNQLIDVLEKYNDQNSSSELPSDAPDPSTLKKTREALMQNPVLEKYGNSEIPIHTTLGNMINVIGEDQVQTVIEESAAKANYKKEYEHSRNNILVNWFHLILFIFAFSCLSVITLEFIDKDKR